MPISLRPGSVFSAYLHSFVSDQATRRYSTFLTLTLQSCNAHQRQFRQSRAFASTQAGNLPPYSLSRQTTHASSLSSTAFTNFVFVIVIVSVSLLDQLLRLVAHVTLLT